MFFQSVCYFKREVYHKADAAKEVMRAEKLQEGWFLPLLALPLMKKLLEKEARGLEKESEGLDEDIIIWIICIKMFSSVPSLSNIEITKYFNCES